MAEPTVGMTFRHQSIPAFPGSGEEPTALMKVIKVTSSEVLFTYADGKSGIALGLDREVFEARYTTTSKEH